MASLENTAYLKIDVSGAKKGRDEFVGAVAAIKQTLAGLDRDSNGLFKRLGKSYSPKVDTSGIKAVESATKPQPRFQGRPGLPGRRR